MGRLTVEKGTGADRPTQFRITPPNSVSAAQSVAKPGYPRWANKFAGREAGAALAGQGFCAALATAVAGRADAAGEFFAALDAGPLVRAAAVAEVCDALGHVLHRHTDRTAGRFVGRFRAILADAGVENPDWLPSRLGDIGVTLSNGARDTAHDLAVKATVGVHGWASYVGTVVRQTDAVPRGDAGAGQPETSVTAGGDPVPPADPRPPSSPEVTADGPTADRLHHLPSLPSSDTRPTQPDPLEQVVTPAKTGASVAGTETRPARPEGVSPPPAEGMKPPASPFVPLTSWGEIFAALNEQHGKVVWRNDEPTRAKIRKLSDAHDGPISFPPGRGRHPSVDKAAFLTWWEKLREHFDARVDQERAEAESARLTVAETHGYGAGGRVVPGIGGSVKQGRRGAGRQGADR